MKYLLTLLLIFDGMAHVSGAQEAVPRGDSGSVVDQSGENSYHQDLSGSFRFDYFSSDKMLSDEKNLYGLTTQLKLLPVLSRFLDGKAEVRISEPDVFGEKNTSVVLLEGYGTAHFDSFALRIGRQIVAWGRADGINPTDNLTPRDYTVLLPLEEDQRMGTNAVTVDAFLSKDVTFTVFSSPYFEPSKIPLNAASGAQIVENRPSHTISNTEVGFKISRVGHELDWSASYYRGFSLIPDFRFIGLSSTGPELEMGYNRIDVFGMDMATNAGRYGFRCEAAYFQTKDHGGADYAVKNPQLAAVVGVDRTFLDNLNINLQFLGRWVSRFKNPEDIADPIVRHTAITNAIIDGQQDRTTYGLSSRIVNKWFNDSLKAELLFVINLTREDSYLRPLVTYSFTDHVNLAFGGEIYGGPEDSYFGRLKPNRGVFIEGRYIF